MEDYSLLKEKKIAILAGGWSAERDISLKSGAAVSMALEELSIDFNFIDLTSKEDIKKISCLLYTSPSPRDGLLSRMPSSA